MMTVGDQSLLHLKHCSADFLPLFVWVLAHCGFETAELEAEYMWGLAHPSLFNGEGGYYLTTLTSAGMQTTPTFCLCSSSRHCTGSQCSEGALQQQWPGKTYTVAFNE